MISLENMGFIALEDTIYLCDLEFQLGFRVPVRECQCDSKPWIWYRTGVLFLVTVHQLSSIQLSPLHITACLPRHSDFLPAIPPNIYPFITPWFH